MSTVKTNNVQIGQSVTATNNFTWYQPASPDGTVRLGNGNSGSVTDVITVGTTGNLTFANSVSLSAASTKTLTLNGGAGSNGLVLDASNNVGIGTGTPGSGAVNAKFTVEGGRSVFADNSNSYAIGVRYNNSTNGFYIGSPAASTLSFSSWGGTELMRLDSSGNLGIGVTPSAWSNSGNVQIGGAGGNLVFNSQYISVGANWYYNAGYKYIGTGPALLFESASGGFDWKIAPSGTAGNAISFTQAMTLDANGNLLVGKTASDQTSIGVNIFKNGTNSGRIEIVNSVAGGIAIQAFYYTNGSPVGSISCTNTATAYNTSSDQRLKENIVDAPSALSSVNAIKVRSFDWKADGSHVDYGYIAQELLEVAPEAVHAPTDPEEMMGVDFGKLTPRLVKAIQELSAELNELKKRVG